MANNTEIVAIISSGSQLSQICQTLSYCCFIVGFSALAINHFILPWANIKKNKLIIYTYSAANRSKFTDSRQISTQLSPTEYVLSIAIILKRKEVSPIFIRNLIKTDD